MLAPRRCGAAAAADSAAAVDARCAQMAATEPRRARCASAQGLREGWGRAALGWVAVMTANASTLPASTSALDAADLTRQIDEAEFKCCSRCP
eukprot:356382-Chlamydomonas_euryale.AAC.2